MSQFGVLVHAYFDGLANSYGLVCETSTDRLVRFQNEIVFLQVLFDEGRSYEIGVEIGQCSVPGIPERPFNLAEVLRLGGVPEADYVAKIQASKQDSRDFAIKRLADLTEKYATLLLQGNVLEFLRLAKFRDKECEDYARFRDLRYARHDAENAWAKRDYLSVIKAYRPVEGNLSHAEKMRLKYAMSHVAKG